MDDLSATLKLRLSPRSPQLTGSPSERSRWRGGRCRVGDVDSPDFSTQIISGSQGGIPVTHLRKMMLEELQRRNYAETTINSYLRSVEEFSRHFNCSPDRLGPRHIREYQGELFQKRKFSPNTVAQRLAALRFFYTKTLKKVWSIEETPYPKKTLHLPTILSQEEVARLIDAAWPPFHRTLLMALYATGLRRAELARLKVSDVDSKRMVIHVRSGKGRKD